MRLTFSIIALLFYAQLFAQFELKPVKQKKHLLTNTERTLQLPFWDDFSQSGDSPDTLLWLHGENIYVNATIGQNAPTYKTATFDGLNSIGNAYNKDSEFNTAGDSLVSQLIDLSQIVSDKWNTVYFSFYWQAGGFGELPDENDSLTVFFRAVSDNPDLAYDWDLVFSQSGGTSNETFEQVLIPLDSSDYFHDAFQFKFVSYSSQRGPFDTWNVDYIYLNENRDENDFGERDGALTGSPSLLFAPYYELPSSVFYANPSQYLSNQMVQLKNLATDRTTNSSYSYLLQDLTANIDYGTYSGSAETGVLEFEEITDINIPEFTSLVISPIEEPEDSTVIESTFIYTYREPDQIDVLYETDRNGNIVLTDISKYVNDTIRSRYNLHNYYAYDDGSAEFALAINAKEGMVAVKYGLGEADILTHVDIFIPSIAPDNVGKSLDILVWRDLTDDGILARKSIIVSEPSGINEFTRVQLSAPVAVNDTIYVGYEQIVEDYLGIGFDRSNTNAGQYIYSNVSGDWEQNTQFEGALMIRPVFAYDSAYQLSAKPKLESPIVYPNPSNGIISISGKYNYVQLYNLAGELIFEEQKSEYHQLPIVKDGIYLLRIANDNNISTQKLRIQYE
ncbi:T9SS type A sorting domain-containing protein [Marinoscillum pacificum]|uniref:T9SS type A sorting domain-containing protein n=1 Tax=Marinoscillum pacificum TaxID=392723 RepID=UPI0021587002|nr:T9SS type A sorting domain-containing protein [Marinoscillum pacificum]